MNDTIDACIATRQRTRLKNQLAWIYRESATTVSSLYGSADHKDLWQGHVPYQPIVQV